MVMASTMPGQLRQPMKLTVNVVNKYRSQIIRRIIVSGVPLLAVSKKVGIQPKQLAGFMTTQHGKIFRQQSALRPSITGYIPVPMPLLRNCTNTCATAKRNAPNIRVDQPRGVRYLTGCQSTTGLRQWPRKAELETGRGTVWSIPTNTPSIRLMKGSVVQWLLPS